MSSSRSVLKIIPCVQRLVHCNYHTSNVRSGGTGYFREVTLDSKTPSDDDLVTCQLDGVNGHIALLTLNNPSKLNALTQPMGDALKQHVDALKANDTLRAVIVTGAGRAFSAGGDLKWLMKRHEDKPENNTDIMVDFYKLFLSLRQLPVPVIGAINGPAIGAGMCMALGGCDIRVAHVKAKMGMTFAKLGLHPGMAATHFLPLLAGYGRAAELIYTSRVIGAQDAYQMGLVNKVCEGEMHLVLDEAIEIAEEICRGAPRAIRESVISLRTAQEANALGLEAAMARESFAQSLTYPTKDLAEGVRAIQEKREPNFTGK